MQSELFQFLQLHIISIQQNVIPYIHSYIPSSYFYCQISSQVFNTDVVIKATW